MDESVKKMLFRCMKVIFVTVLIVGFLYLAVALIRDPAATLHGIGRAFAALRD